MFLGFILGLLVGVAALLWQRLQTRIQFTRLLNEITPEGSTSSFSLSSQLLAAIATQNNYIQSLQSRIRLYQFMLASAPIAFLHVDDENRLVWCNPLAQQLFHITKSQFPEPRLLLELVRSYELDELIEQVRQHRHPQEKAWTFYPLNTNPARVLKQQSFSLKGFGFPMFDNHVGIFIEDRQDIALLKQQRDRWTSDVAHELKTPLTSIRLIAETLQPRVGPSLIKWADRLIDQSTRLSNLVQDLLDLSQLEGGSMARIPECRMTDLPELIHTVWNSLEPISGKKQIQFQYTGPDALPIFCDESRIYRVLSNLLDNSIKYSPIRETIHINVQLLESERWVQIELIDSGPGFLDDDLPHIFERFYRADTSRSRINASVPSIPSNPQETGPIFDTATASQTISGYPTSAFVHSGPIASPGLTSHESPQSSVPGGTGLGLSIAQQIIEAHGGEIEADNRSSQTGAVIRIRLPLDKRG